MSLWCAVALCTPWCRCPTGLMRAVFFPAGNGGVRRQYRKINPRHYNPKSESALSLNLKPSETALSLNLKPLFRNRSFVQGAFHTILQMPNGKGTFPKPQTLIPEKGTHFRAVGQRSPPPPDSGLRVWGLGYPKPSLPPPCPPFLSCKAFSPTQRTALAGWISSWYIIGRDTPSTRCTTDLSFKVNLPPRCQL